VILEVLPAQAFATNCWVIAPSKNSECFIVDPGITAPSIVPALSEILRRHNLKPIATLVTHGHLDHTFSVLPFSEQYGVPTYIQRSDRKLLANPFLALAAGGATQSIMDQLGVKEFHEPSDVREFLGGERFSLAGFDIETIHAPGHTAGSAMFVVNDEYLISGDVLFHDGIGRTDMPTGSSSTMAQTLLTKVLTLDDALNVLPGHGAVTTIGRERKQSPYLRPEYLETMKRGGDRG
jgi:glyoxylase-like metal-dependent hydrolase (beta-lactamase superfamily II)